MTSCYVRDGTSSPFPPSDHISSSVARFRRSNIVCRVHRQAPPQTLTRHLSSFYWQSPIFSCLLAGTLPSMSKKKKKKESSKLQPCWLQKTRRDEDINPAGCTTKTHFLCFHSLSMLFLRLVLLWPLHENMFVYRRVRAELWFYLQVCFWSLFETLCSALLRPEMLWSYQVTWVSVTCIHQVLKVHCVCVESKICFFDLCHEKINTAFTSVCKIIEL